METLLHWDTQIMHWINAGWSNVFFDWLMPWMRNKLTWVPLYIFCLAWVIYNFSSRQILFVIGFLAASIFASDTISSKLIKNQIQRPRPCHELHMEPPVVLRINCGSGYSFTSSHATNHFCIATFAITVFGFYMKKWKYSWLLWALLISVAQVYVGVHYPLDILGGALLGTLVGWTMGTLCKHKMKQSKIKMQALADE